MANQPPYPGSNGNTDDNSGVGPDPGSAYSTPRWVKVSAIIAVALLLLVVVMFVAGGHTPPIQHGP